MSHPFRAMKLWVVLHRYGVAGMRAYIRRHVEMAKWFERMLEADERFEVVVPRRFSLVTFRLRPRHEGHDDMEALNRKLLVAINGSRRAFMTHFVVDSKFVIRMVVGAARPEPKGGPLHLGRCCLASGILRTCRSPDRYVVLIQQSIVH